MSLDGIELYSTLEHETGLATGWKQCGSLNVARTADRLTSTRRQMARAQSFGIEFDFVAPADAARQRSIPHPTTSRGVDSRRRQGESHRSHPVARPRRAQRRRGRSPSCTPRHRRRRRRRAGRRSAGAATARERSGRESIVNCAGQRARVRPAGGRQRPALLGRALLPRHRTHRRRHARAAGDPRPRRLPLLQGGSRRPGEGGFEPRAKPWNVVRIPDRFEFQLLPEDWDQFEILNAQRDHRTPCHRVRRK